MKAEDFVLMIAIIPKSEVEGIVMTEHSVYTVQEVTREELQHEGAVERHLRPSFAVLLNLYRSTEE